MALWDIEINEKPLASPTLRWGIDVFEGAHVIPDRKDFLTSNPLAVGANVTLGPYDTALFSLGGWVEGDTPHEAEVAAAHLVSQFGPSGGGAQGFRWRGHDGAWRYAEMRVLASQLEPRGRRGYRFSVAMENLLGAWYGDWVSTERTIGGWLPGSPGAWPSFIASVDVVGPVTSPVLQAGDTSPVRFDGTVPAGEVLRFNSHPTKVNALWRGYASELGSCTYSPTWGYLFNLIHRPEGLLRVTGAGLSSESKFILQYRPVLP